MSNVAKSYEITDARIRFVSLVDRAANLKKFLLTKAENGSAGFQTNGRILKVDDEKHYVTGIVYEPMVADAHDNFMTEEEIEKAAHWFMKNGDKVDIQHSFEEADGLTVVESSVTKAEQEIDGETVKKGTWLMTIEVANDTVWNAIKKGELTGMSMGGVGNYSTEDVSLDVEKAAEKPSDSIPEKLNLLERIAKMLGVESAVVKGEVREKYDQERRASGFWTAWETLHRTLVHYDYWEDKAVYESDEAKVRDALTDFCDIIQELLSGPDVAKALHDSQPKEDEGDAESLKEENEMDEIEKAGKKMSKANKDKLTSIAQQLTDFVKEFDDEPDEPAEAAESKANEQNPENKEEEDEMSKDEIQKMIDEAIQKAAKPATQPETESAPVTAEAVQKMIDEAVEKAISAENQPQEETDKPAPLDEARIAKMIEESISKAMKARGISAVLTDDSDEAVEKNDAPQHYLHGIL